MKKLIVILIILGVLIVANIIIKNEDSQSNINMPSLAQAISLEPSVSSYKIINDKNKIILITNGSCYKIQNLDYCADFSKIQLLQKFLQSKVKDIYDKTTENLNRLGFKNETVNSSIVINNTKTLIFGNTNKYNEMYVLQSDKIYKVDYYQGIFETTSKYWADKSEVLLPFVDTDKFTVQIIEHIGNNKTKRCELIEQSDLSDTKYSTLRNSFFDLYASDVTRLREKDESLFFDMGISVLFDHPYTGEEMYSFEMWKDDHLVYFASKYSENKKNNLKYTIPNSVYENISVYCKK
tara:strand:+ start:1811 stop:2692 length:882 start_codon:yes stop_codon:yes gene_type:complete